MLSLYAGLIDYWPLYGVSGGEVGRASALAMSDEGSVGSADGKLILARDFNGSNQRLVHASDMIVQTGNTSFTWCCWVKLDALSTGRGFITKDSTSGSGREYSLSWAAAVSRFRFSVFRSGPIAVDADATAFGAVSTGVWHFVIAWHDATVDTANIEINARYLNSIATGGALQSSGTADLHFGSFSDNSFHLDGQICEVGFWKRVLASHERNWLYNNGRGRSWPFDGRPSPVLLNPHRRRTREA
jgi:hypothetical protein